MSARAERAGPEKSAAFYNRIAHDYDVQMSGPDDTWIRSAFWDFVAARIPREARVLDFGCGTGIDAAHYVEQGHQVLAYDNSARMIDTVRRRCAVEIAGGVVDAWSAPYEGFRESLRERPAFTVVTANFAAVNHLPDVDVWLDALAERAPGECTVLVSSLNACPLLDLRRRAFWRRALRGGHGHKEGLLFQGEAYDHVRYWPWRLGRGSRTFRVVSRAGVGGLLGGNPGARDWQRPRTIAERLERAGWQTWPGWLAGRFTFVELRRR